MKKPTIILLLALFVTFSVSIIECNHPTCLNLSDDGGLCYVNQSPQDASDLDAGTDTNDDVVIIDSPSDVELSDSSSQSK